MTTELTFKEKVELVKLKNNSDIQLIQVMRETNSDYPTHYYLVYYAICEVHGW